MPHGATHAASSHTPYMRPCIIPCIKPCTIPCTIPCIIPCAVTARAAPNQAEPEATPATTEATAAMLSGATSSEAVTSTFLVHVAASSVDSIFPASMTARVGCVASDSLTVDSVTLGLWPPPMTLRLWPLVSLPQSGALMHGADLRPLGVRKRATCACTPSDTCP